MVVLHVLSVVFVDIQEISDRGNWCYNISLFYQHIVEGAANIAIPTSLFHDDCLVVRRPIGGRLYGPY